MHRNPFEKKVDSGTWLRLPMETSLYKLIQEEGSIFWEVKISVIVTKKFIWMVTEIELFDSPELTPLDVGVWGWMKSEGYKREVGTHETNCSHFASCCPQKETWRSTQTNNTRSSHKTWKCIEVGGGIFENLLSTASNLSFQGKKCVIKH
jgi:hypothetical protein